MMIITKYIEKMKKKFYLRFMFIVFISSLILLFNCEDINLNRPGVITGRLTLQLSTDPEGLQKTIEPDSDMQIDNYTIMGTGPESENFTQENINPGTVYQKSLAPGNWVITVDGISGEGTVVGRGVVEVTILAGENTGAEVTVAPLPGTGFLALDVSWPDSLYSNPEVTGTITPSGGSTLPITFTMAGDSLSASYSDSLEAGYYQTSILLSDEDSIVWGRHEVARIVAGARTSRSYLAVDDTSANQTEKVSVNSYIEIPFKGPMSEGMSSISNPFKVIMDVSITSPFGEVYSVPAFYDGDGNGGLDGNIWKVRFTPDTPGIWTYVSSSTVSALDNITGTFDATNNLASNQYTPGGLPDFSSTGRLEYSNDKYLHFANGLIWLKGGANEPESFLGPEVTAGFPSKEEAIDYLASVKVNAMYILLHNIGGDGKNVWPWVGTDTPSAKSNHEHFDINKLAEWERIFSYIQSKGIVLHLVLEDDSGWTGFNRTMYYREIVARFAHHNGIIWNISEEYNENYTATEVKNFADMLRNLDPYDHPITIHNQGPLENWSPFLGYDNFDIASLQYPPKEPDELNMHVADWAAKAAESGKFIPIGLDETLGLEPSDVDLTRHIVWAVYLAGGNIELFTNPLNDFRDYASHFVAMSNARSVLEEFPLSQMSPQNEILINPTGYVLGEPNKRYVAYLPEGGTTEIDFSTLSGTYSVYWINPKNGDQFYYGNISATSPYTDPPSFPGDAVLLLEK